jgi:hypothetical protein
MMFSSQAIAANIAYYEDWCHLLPRIKCPVMLVKARGGDEVTDEDFLKMKTMIPNCIVYEVSNPDHNVHLGNNDSLT